MNSPVVILHLEDDAHDAELVRDKLQQCGLVAHDLRLARGRKEFEAALDETRFDLIISDYNLPDYDGMAALALAGEKQPHVPFIIISGQLGEEKALECIHCGATDYVPKQRLDWLVPAVVRALAEAEDRQKCQEAEADLRKSASQTHAMFEQAAVGIAMVGLDGRWLRVNRRLCEMVGYSADELLKLRFQDITHPDDVAEDVDAVRAIVSGERASYFREKRYVRKNRDVIWIHVTVGLAKDEAGQPSYFVSVFEDVTERKRAEEKALRSHQNLEAIMDSMDALAYVADMETLDLLFLNKYGRDIFLGFAPGKKCFEVLQTGQTSRCSFCTNDRLVDAAGTPTGVYRWEFQNTKTGAWFECRDQAIRWHDGRLVRLEVATDVTERKKVEMQLAHLLHQHELVLGSAAEGILGLDLQGKHTFVNPAAATMLGYRVEELLGRPSHSCWHHTRTDGSTHPEEQCEISATLREGVATRSHSDLFWRKDGTSFPAEFSSTPIVEDGVPIGSVVTFVDITDRKQMEAEREKLEEQLRASQKMEAIGSLAGGVAHDFNNLLSVILSYAGFAMEGVRDGDPLKNDLLEVKKAGERAAALTRQLLAFSRKQVLQPVALSLNQSSASVEKMLRRILGEDIDLVQTLAPDLGLTLADPGQIEQVLMNLVVNARDAMPEGGKLTIETSNVEIDEEYAARHVAVKPGSYVQLAVSDTGCGMDEQTRTRIFEPFFTTKEKGKGTGLGLSTVYGIVKQSGGNIWVYSELGQGTTFKVYLPRDLSATAATDIKPSTVPKRATGTETILVVEDEEALRKVALRTLGAAGYKVLTAVDGDEALLRSVQHAGDIHLLLTDVVMPRMSGRVLAQELVKTRPTLRVVYMSGYTDDAIVHHGVLDAGTHFLAKPFTSADLTRKVREVLDIGVTNLADGQEQAVKGEAEKKEQPLDEAALRPLSPDVLARLRQAVIAARYNEIVKIIETIRVAEPNVAAELRRMADLFDYDGMRDLLSDGTESQRGK